MTAESIDMEEPNMKMVIKLCIAFAFVIFIAEVLFPFALKLEAANARTAENVAEAINDYGLGGGTGTPLTASITGRNEVTVDGDISGATIGLSLEMDPDVRLIWKASLVGNTSGNPHYAMIKIIGRGTMEITGGIISQDGIYNAIHTDGSVLLSGGIVRATSERNHTIVAGAVEVSGDAQVLSSGAGGMAIESTSVTVSDNALVMAEGKPVEVD